MLKKIITYHLPLTLTLFSLITIERLVNTDGGYTRLYGLPLPYISNSYAFSMSYDVFILPLLVNLVFYFLVSLAFFWLIERLGTKLKTHWILTAVGILIIVFWTGLFYIHVFDSSFTYFNTMKYETTHWRLKVVS